MRGGKIIRKFEIYTPLPGGLRLSCTWTPSCTQQRLLENLAPQNLSRVVKTFLKKFVQKSVNFKKKSVQSIHFLKKIRTIRTFYFEKIRTICTIFMKKKIRTWKKNPYNTYNFWKKNHQNSIVNVWEFKLIYIYIEVD